MENENVNTEQQTESQQTERLFTKDEVNAIVQKRLGKIKDHKDHEVAISDESLMARAKELDEREAALNARETRQTCQSYLRERGLSDDLLDVFGTSSAEEFIQKVEIAQTALGVSAYPSVKDSGSVLKPAGFDDLRSVFLNTPAHKPKENNPYW